MKFLAILGLLALTFVAGRAEEVLTLTTKDFDSTIQQNEVIMVEFYAPWCGHCKNLAPKYEAAAVQLKGVASLAKVDCTVENDICSKFDVRGYPTVKVFRGGKPSDYQGARETDAIVSFMKKQLLPALSVLENGEAVEKFSASDRVVIIGFFESSESEAYKTFSSVANSLRDDFVFGVTTDKDSFEKFGASSPQDIILFKKFDEGKNDFDGEFEEDDIVDFIKKYSIPLMDDVGPQNYQSYMEAGIPLAYLFVTGEEDRSTVGKAVEKVAAEFKGKINFVYIDANQYGGHANNLNLKVGEWPSFAIQDPTKNLKFPFSGAISTESIRDFCTGVVSGEISPSLKSAPVPTEQGPVFVVVGKNYDEVVNSGKNVLIEFYAPWCGHCKKLAPIYDDLGKAYENDKEVIIAKMDATENDLPADAPFQIQGFPTIKFIKSDGTILDYNGDRSLENFKSFIEQNAIRGAEASSSGSAQKEEL